LLQLLIKYKNYSALLKWLCIFALVYPITVFIVKPPWWQVIKNSFIPHIEFKAEFLFLITGVFGTTISPYMFFWESAQEVEEDHKKELISKRGKTRITKKEILRIRLDNIIGMIASQIISWSILVISATVFFENNMKNIKNSTQAAQMLKPLVHNFSNSGYIAEI